LEKLKTTALLDHGGQMHPADTFQKAWGVGFKLCCISQEKLGLLFTVGASAVFCYFGRFPVFWCAGSEYEQESRRTWVFMLQVLGDMPWLCWPWRMSEGTPRPRATSHDHNWPSMKVFGRRWSERSARYNSYFAKSSKQQSADPLLLLWS